MGRSMTFPRAGYPFEVYMLVLLPPLTAQIQEKPVPAPFRWRREAESQLY